MLISDSRRYTSVLVVINSMISRKGLFLLSYNDREAAIDTPLLTMGIYNCATDYPRICIARKFTSIEIERTEYISHPLFTFLFKLYDYHHYKFNALRVGRYIPQMLFVGAAGCELLPPMRYSAPYGLISYDCKVDLAGKLPTRLTLL